MTGHGPGRLLAATYALLALAGGARAAVQLATRPQEAPLAYALSALAAAVYALAAATLQRAPRVAVAALGAELAGVLVTGSLTLARPRAFPDETVWSAYGRGYGHLPLVLPIVGLAWLRVGAARARAR